MKRTIQFINNGVTRVCTISAPTKLTIEIVTELIKRGCEHEDVKDTVGIVHVVCADGVENE